MCGRYGPATSSRHEVTSSGALYSFYVPSRLPMPLCTDLLAVNWSWRRATAPRRARHATTRSDLVCGLHGAATSPRHEVTSSGAPCGFHGLPRLLRSSCRHLLTIVWSWERSTAPRRARHVTTHSDKCYQPVHSGYHSGLNHGDHHGHHGTVNTALAVATTTSAQSDVSVDGSVVRSTVSNSASGATSSSATGYERRHW